MTDNQLIIYLRALSECRTTNCSDCPIPEIAGEARACLFAEEIWKEAANRLEELINK